MKRIAQILFFIALAFLPAPGAVFVKTEGWYQALNKPVWNPPAWIFGPVWTGLYLMIGLAGYFAWTRGCRANRPAVFVVYGMQLFVNALWSPLFFGLHRIGWALTALVLLWFLVLLCIGLFSQRSLLAAWLLAPYFLWISFAGALNVAIMAIN